MQPPESIDAGVVVLKRWESAWATQATSAVQASLPELTPFMPWADAGYAIDTSVEFIARSTDQWKDGTTFNYAVFDPAGELVGSCGLMTRMGPGILEIGYWIHSGHTGRGYASAAAAALARVGLSLPGIDRVMIKHDAANPASGAVAAKAGFTQVGRVEHERQASSESGTDLLWELRA